MREFIATVPSKTSRETATQYYDQLSLNNIAEITGKFRQLQFAENEFIMQNLMQLIFQFLLVLILLCATRIWLKIINRFDVFAVLWWFCLIGLFSFVVLAGPIRAIVEFHHS